MAEVAIEVGHTTLVAGNGRDVEGIVVTCTKCSHSVAVYGTSDEAVQQGTATLAEQCPRGEKNLYREA